MEDIIAKQNVLKDYIMKQLNIKQGPALILGCLLTLPAAYLIFISLMKFEFNRPYLFDAVSPFLEAPGVIGSPGWNINLLILFGPVPAFLLSLLSVADIHFASGNERISCHVSIRKSLRKFSILIISGMVMLVSFAYLVGENCIC